MSAKKPRILHQMKERSTNFHVNRTVQTTLTHKSMKPSLITALHTKYETCIYVEFKQSKSIELSPLDPTKKPYKNTQ